MRTTTTLLSCCLCFALPAQSPYRPFPESNAVWIEYHDGIVGQGCQSIELWAHFHRSIQFGADEEHDGHTYHWLRVVDDGTAYCPGTPWWEGPYHVDAYDWMLFRQDTTERKVYYWYSGDYLLFDFSLNVGDTMGCCSTVLSKDSILLGDGYHRRWNLQCIGCGLVGPFTSLIEGVGATFYNGPLWDLGPGFEYGAQLECFSRNGVVQYTDTIDGPPICDPSIAMSVRGGLTNEPSLRTYPNPTEGLVMITGEIPLRATYLLTDALGRTLGSGLLIDRHIDLTDLGPSPYLVLIRDSHGRSIATLRVLKVE